MPYNFDEEAMGCTNELFYRYGAQSEDIRRGEANYVMETIKRYLKEAYAADREEKLPVR